MKSDYLLTTLLIATASALEAATTITVTTNVVVNDVHRFGLNLAQINYYDSGQMMKELVFSNPGFEGQLFQSIIRLGSGTETNAIEDHPWTGWPTGFWDDARFEIINGAARGRTGIVVHSIAPIRTGVPPDPGASSNGTTYLFADVGSVPAEGNYMIVRKRFDGDGMPGGAATEGWRPSATNGGSITTELLDLPADTQGRQCVRITATNAGATANLAGVFDSWNNTSFIQLRGNYQLTYKAKGCGGNNSLAVTLRRGVGTYWIAQSLSLSNAWGCYTNTFSASESNALGPVSLTFAATNSSAVLLDDVSLRQTGDDPANTSPFRDPVIAAIQGLRPSFLRYPTWQHLGDSLENELTPPLARRRSGYSSYGTAQHTLLLGVHEFLQVCDTVHADPWCSTPITFTPDEMRGLMEYLGGSTNTPYGRVRLQLGRAAPWTEAFRVIHIEFGNESWNGGYRGGNIADYATFGSRADELFGTAKSSPYYTSNRFDFIIGDQWVSPWRVGHTHNASTNHDTFCVAGYMASQVNQYATNEELFGSLFAEPEWWSKPGGLLYQDYTNITLSPRPVPVAIYEVNINIPGGDITNSQAALTAYTPSLGAGLAAADHMLLALHDLKMREQGLFSLPGYAAQSGTNWSYVWSIVHDMGVTDRKRPVYRAIQLANAVLAGDMVETTHSGDNPTWSVTNLNNVSFTNAHRLQSYAFSAGATQSVVLFNLDLSNALEVAFAGPLAPTGSVQLQRLTAASITANNESSNVVVITAQALGAFNPAVPLTVPPYSMTTLQWALPVPRFNAILAQPPGPVHLQWESDPSLHYQVQYSADLQAWLDAGGALAGSNAVTTFIDDGSQTGGSPPDQAAQRFYRVLVVP